MYNTDLMMKCNLVFGKVIHSSITFFCVGAEFTFRNTNGTKTSFDLTCSYCL